MQRLLFTIVLVLAIVVAGCSSDPECVAVTSAGRDGWDAEVVAATKAPDEAITGNERWYFASATGGLWVSTGDPETGGGGMGVPLNSRARSEDILGLDVSPSARAFDDTDAGSAAAEEALRCAREGVSG